MTKTFNGDIRPDYKKTPPKMSEPPSPIKSDPADNKHRYVWQTRSGHHTVYSDHKGNEFINIGHRTGTGIRWNPDGSLETYSGKGIHVFCLGPMQTMVTGAQDTSIRGDHSVMVDGDSRTTTKGNMETTVAGDMAQTAKNVAFLAENQFDVAATSGNIETKNGFSLKSTEGAIALESGEGNVSMGSGKGAVAFKSAKTSTIESGGDTALTSGGDTHIKASGEQRMTAGGDMHLIGGSGEIAIVGGKVYINSGMAQQAGTAAEKYSGNKSKAPPKTGVA